MADDDTVTATIRGTQRRPMWIPGNSREGRAVGYGASARLTHNDKRRRTVRSPASEIVREGTLVVPSGDPQGLLLVDAPREEAPGPRADDCGHYRQWNSARSTPNGGAGRADDVPLGTGLFTGRVTGLDIGGVSVERPAGVGDLFRSVCTGDGAQL